MLWSYSLVLFRAVVFIAHGITEHCGRHHKLAVLLQENQFAVYAHDHGTYVSHTCIDSTEHEIIRV